MEKQSHLPVDLNKKEAFYELYHIYAESALRTAIAITRNHEIAKDAVQETFIRIYHHRDHYDPNKSFEPWFYRILINECNRLLKKESKLLKLNQPLSEKEYQLSTSVEEDYSDLYQVLQALKDLYRIPIILKYLQGFSEKEIATILKLNRNTVKTRLRKGREQLKKKLAANHEEGSKEYGF